MKVPTYQQSVQRSQDIPQRSLSVSASPGGFSQVAQAKREFFMTLAGASADVAKSELQQRNESERLNALNESNKMLSETAQAAEQMAINDPDSADKYWDDSVAFHREKQAATITNEATRQQFLIEYDANATRGTARMMDTTRKARATQATATWVERKNYLFNAAAKGDTSASQQLFGNPELGIPSHWDKAVDLGLIAADKAAQQEYTSRAEVGKQRLINHASSLTTLDQLNDFEAALKSGKIPPDLRAEFDLMLPNEVRQLTNILESEINSIEAANKAAAAILSKEQRVEFTKKIKDPNITLDEVKDFLTDLLLGPSKHGLTDSDWLATISAAESRRNQLITTVNAEVRSIEGSLRQTKQTLRDGFPVNDEAFLAIGKQINNLGEAAPADLRREYDAISRNRDTLAEWKKLSPVQLDANINKIRDFNRQNPSIDSQFLITTGEKMLAALTTKISNGDAMGAAYDRDIVTQVNLAPNIYALDSEGAKVINQEALKTYTLARQNAYKVQAQFGLPEPQFLSKVQADAFKAILGGDDPVMKLAVIESIQQGFREDAGFVFQQIADDKNMALYGNLGGLLMDQNNRAVELAMQGEALIKNNQKPGDFTSAFLDTEFRRLSGSAFDAYPQVGQGVKSTANMIYAKIAAGKEVFDAELYGQAFHLATGGVPDGSIGGVQNFRGEEVLLPSRVATEDVEDALSNLTPEILADPEVSGNIVDDRMAADFANQQYKLLPTGNGRYKLYYGSLRDTNTFVIVSDGNNEDIEIDLLRLLEINRSGRVQRNNALDEQAADMVVSP